MPSYQLRDTATRRLLARGLSDYAAAEATTYSSSASTTPPIRRPCCDFPADGES